MFGKFMNKKFFHPGSYPNIQRKWMAEQKASARQKKQEDLASQYQKEQDLYENRVTLSGHKDEKLKLGLNFMYEAPPGMKREVKDDEPEAEVKFEWQKSAPREGYAKDLGLDVHDQPFGICVRNVKCFKCKQWGHVNTDKECPKFNVKTAPEGSGLDSLLLSDPLMLVESMKTEHGIALRKSVVGREIDPMLDNQQILASDDEEEDDPDVKFIKSLSTKQKKKLLKKLSRMDEAGPSKSTKHKKRKRDDSRESEHRPEKAKHGSVHKSKKRHKHRHR